MHLIMIIGKQWELRDGIIKIVYPISRKLSAISWVQMITEVDLDLFTLPEHIQVNYSGAKLRTNKASFF